MRLLPVAFFALAACGGSQLDNLSLKWRGVDDSPKPSPTVAQALATNPLAFGMRDVRPDPTAVGTYEDGSFVVRTTDNVAQFCSMRLGEMLAHAGARMNETPSAVLETELLEYRVVEGGAFNGTVKIRAIVRRSGAGEWSQTYEGTSKRWGRSHNADNYNEALSNALADAASHLVEDDGFAHALLGDAPMLPLPPAPPPAVGPSGA